MKVFFSLSVIVFFCAMHAGSNDVDKKIREKIVRISPQASRHLKRLNSAQLLAQAEIEAAKLENRNPSELALLVAVIPTSHPDKMWHQIASIQECTKNK